MIVVGGGILGLAAAFRIMQTRPGIRLTPIRKEKILTQHQTEHKIGGGVGRGPNAGFAFGREAYPKTDFNLHDSWEALTWPGFHKVATKYGRSGLEECYRVISKQAFVKSLRKLIPEIQAGHLDAGGSGIPAQVCDRQGNLLDNIDFRVDGNLIHVCNSPSPAAIAYLAIGNTIADRALALL
jgi:(S)-2-hydroxyglutarate dehydrogenase